MQKQISNSIQAAKARLLKQNRENKMNEPDTIKPPAIKIVMTDKERGYAEAWGYSRSMYLAGATLEAM